MNFKNEIINKLKKYSKDKILITPHAQIRMFQRQIDEKEVIDNIINPVRLEYAIKEKSNYNNEEKFDCYFKYSKTQCHRYVLLLKNKVLIITVIKINRRWQKIVENKLKWSEVND